MDYIVLDLEWNQPVSKNSYPYLNIGDRMSNEIIQIGAYKVSEGMKIVDSFCTYVKPKYYKKLNSMVKKITNIDKEKILSGISFVDAMELFSKWCGDDFALFTWGSDDVYVMRQNLDFYGVDKTFIKKWYDLQKIFSRTYLGESTQRSLQFAMEHFNISEEEDRNMHDASDDAYYTAKIFVNHDIKSCMKVYAAESDFSKMCSALDDTSYGSFFTKRKALANKNVAAMVCPECGADMKRYGAWVSGGEKYLCVGECSEHGEFLGRIKLNKHLDGKFYVNKTIKKAPAKVYENVKEKCDAALRYAQMRASGKRGKTEKK